jgi:hypothetical protein
MLNLPIAMLKLPLILSLVFFLQATDISITSPQPAETLRGQVEIAGNMDVPNFASAELAFSFPNSTGYSAWFVIQTFSQPAKTPIIAVWDTSLVTDGEYDLHLRVYLQDGSMQDAIVTGLKIQNDAPTATATLAVTATPEFFTTAPPPTMTLRPAPTLQTFPSPTPLLANPAAVIPSSIYMNFGRGALIAFVLFLFFSLILRLRKS